MIKIHAPHAEYIVAPIFVESLPGCERMDSPDMISSMLGKRPRHGPKRAYGDGTYTCVPGKPGHFHVTFRHNGKRSPKYLVIGEGVAAYNEAKRRFEAWRAQQVLDAVRGEKERRTVGFFLDSHWEATKGNLKPTTVFWTESTRRKHVMVDKEFLALDIYDLTSDDFQAFLARRKASDNTKHRIYSYLHKSFEALVQEGKLSKNPIHLIKAKKPRKSRSNVVSFSEDDERALIRYCRDSEPWWYPIVLLLFDAGLRQSELLGMCFDKVDFKSGQIFIHRSLLTLKGGRTELRDELKTASSKRAIFLAPTTLAALKALATGQGRAQCAHVVSIDGKPVSRFAFDNLWGKLLKSAGISHKGTHSCRHTMATRLLKSGCYITSVSKRLGHASPSVTLDKYSDAIPSDDHRLAASFEAALKLIDPDIDPGPTQKIAYFEDESAA